VETKPTYTTPAIESEPLPADENNPACTCGQPIGVVVLHEGRYWLFTGSRYLYAIHGRCVCGAWIHWTRSEYLLIKLTKAMQVQQRKNC